MKKETFKCKNCEKRFVEDDMRFNVTSGYGICDECWEKADGEDKKYYNGIYIQQ